MFRPAFKNSIVKALSMQCPISFIANYLTPPLFKIGPLSIYDYHVKLIFTCTVYTFCTCNVQLLTYLLEMIK